MLSDDDLAFARAALDGGVLPLEDLLRASARMGRDGPRSTLRETLVRDGYLSDETALDVARAALRAPRSRRLAGPRYELGHEIGRGANGVVLLAGDQRLGRKVAMKLQSKGSEVGDIELQRFCHEAQVTGQLAHPGVVPVHDLGVLPDGRPYYTMKRVDGTTLKEVLDSLKDGGDASLVETWTVPHMVSVLLRVAQALAFAHDHGVVHRDVKPANIMVGDYGEVLLMDWGVARVLAQPADGRDRVTTWRSQGDEDPTVDGTVAGTPAYMAPEQARGDIPAIGPASDVYSVGVILYEYLTGSRPFRASNVRDLLDRVIHDPIRAPSAVGAGAAVPAELDQLCLTCVDKDPARRYPDGSALAEALQAFLEGSRRRDEARKLARRALTRSSAYARAAESARRQEEALRAAEQALPPWAGAEERRRLWDQESAWRQVRKLRDDTYDEAVALFQAALENEPNHADARSGLASLYLRRMDESEARGEHDAARFFRSQVLRWDTGVLRRFLEGPARLFVRTEPSSASVTLYRVEERDRVLSRGRALSLGRTPVDGIELEPGGWLLEIAAEGRVPVLMPLSCDRPLEIRRELHLRSTVEVPEGFVLVPGGPFLRGGDPLALDAAARETVELPDFAISKFPINVADFQRWLDAEGHAAGFDCWTGPPSIPRDEQWRLPALGVTRFAAQAYASWLSEKTGLRLRLPTHDEWEKAARGVDGRAYPWGNSWQAAYCNGPDAFPDEPRPRPVGSCPQDCSVYGVMDLSGGVSEWVQGAVPHRPDRGWLRGGSWNSLPRQARLASRLSLPLQSRGGTNGFRLLLELDG